MLFKKNLTLLICLSISFLFIVGFVVYMLNYSSPNEYFIFQDINECSQLLPAEQSNLTIDKYALPEKDKYLNDLSYDHFWGMKFYSTELEYEFFAYEFVDSDSALKYYISVTGQNSYEKELPLSSDDPNRRLSSSNGMFFYRLVVVYQNKAYLVIAPDEYEDEINQLLAKTFSYPLS